MKGNQKGFSLIELIVSMAILGIIAVAEVTFISSGSHIYRSVLNDVNLQVEAQTATNQLENYLINCSAGVCFRDKTLYIMNQDVGGSTEYVFEFDSSTGQINYSAYSVAVTAGGTVTRSLKESGLMAVCVEGFSAVPETDSSGNVSSVEVTLKFSKRNASYTAVKKIALRNRPLKATTENQMLQTA